MTQPNNDRAPRRRPESNGVQIPRIDHMEVEGEGSVTIAEIHCDGECHRLEIVMRDKAIHARWLD